MNNGIKIGSRVQYKQYTNRAGIVGHMRSASCVVRWEDSGREVDYDLTDIRLF